MPYQPSNHRIIALNYSSLAIVLMTYKILPVIRYGPTITNDPIWHWVE
jgi:hypothetical protein